MDVFDQATELERLDREAALSRGEPIPQKRLEALPGVGLCRACQEERESGR